MLDSVFFFSVKPTTKVSLIVQSIEENSKPMNIADCTSIQGKRF